MVAENYVNIKKLVFLETWIIFLNYYFFKFGFYCVLSWRENSLQMALKILRLCLQLKHLLNPFIRNNLKRNLDKTACVFNVAFSTLHGVENDKER